MCEPIATVTIEKSYYDKIKSNSDKFEKYGNMLKAIGFIKRNEEITKEFLIKMLVPKMVIKINKDGEAEIDYLRDNDKFYKDQIKHLRNKLNQQIEINKAKTDIITNYKNLYEVLEEKVINLMEKEKYLSNKIREICNTSYWEKIYKKL